MIFKWIVLIVEINTERKSTNQTLHQLKHNQIQRKKTKGNKNNKKNDLKGGSVSENDQEDNTKFLTLTRKMIDNK